MLKDDHLSTMLGVYLFFLSFVLYFFACEYFFYFGVYSISFSYCFLTQELN